MARERVALPFGPGIDRVTGKMAVNPRGWSDLRNAYPSDGKIVLRPTLNTTWYPKFTTETDILCVAGLRATKDILLVTLDRATGAVELWRINPIAAPTLQLVGGWSSVVLPLTEDNFPRIVAAESFGKLYFAHAQPDSSIRFATIAYTPNAADALVGTLAVYQQNLDGAGLANTYFSGVYAYNDSLWAWGYGSASDVDRPEILRVSNPGAPDTMQPQALFYVGARKDPITAVVQVGNILAVRKRTEGYRVIGNSPANYSLEPAEVGHGCEGQRLIISVAKRAYCWSHDGPREILGDGSSVDLAPGIDLSYADPRDVVPNGGGGGIPVIVTPARVRQGFLAFEHSERLLRFVFPSPVSREMPTGEYICSIQNPDQPQWSYGVFSDVQPLCAANVVTDKTLSPPAIIATFANLAVAWATASGGFLQPTVSFDLSNIRGDELIRISSVKQGISGANFRVDTLVPVRAIPNVATDTVSIRVPGDFVAGDQYRLYVDVIRPDNWTTPGAAGVNILSQALPAAAPFAMQAASWRRVSATRHEVRVSWSGGLRRWARLVLQVGPAAVGPWTDVATYTENERLGVYYPTEAERGTTLYFRVVLRGDGAGEFASTTTVSCFIGPTGSPSLTDYGFRSNLPANIDLIIATPANAARLDVSVSADGGAFVSAYLGDVFSTSDGWLTNLAGLTGAVTTDVRMRAAFHTHGAEDWGPYTTVTLVNPVGGAFGAVTPPTTSFVAQPTGGDYAARVNFNGAEIAGGRVFGFFSWGGKEGEGADTHRIRATEVNGGANFDTNLPHSARGQVVSYTYWAITNNRVTRPPVTVSLGVCP